MLFLQNRSLFGLAIPLPVEPDVDSLVLSSITMNRMKTPTRRRVVMKINENKILGLWIWKNCNHREKSLLVLLFAVRFELQ